MEDAKPDSRFLSGSGAGPDRFLSTAWTEIVKAQGEGDEAARRYLGGLIQRYWRPVYHFIRRSGRSHEDAKDLTQGFFTRFLEKDALRYADRSRGRFRSFLAASVRRYLAQEHRGRAARPGEELVADFDTALHERCFGRDEDPDAGFHRNWLKCLVENSIARLRAECAALGKGEQHEAFALRYAREASPSNREIADALGVSVKDVENLLHRARRRFRRLFLDEVRNSMLAGGDAEEEVRELLAALS
jgi:RNA polymerase sigma-70 factor (ECF subfamily)